jgi:hypothetical protein
MQMTSKPGEEEGTKIKKTVLLERLNPAWMAQQFNAKFLKMVRTASSRAGFYMKGILFQLVMPDKTTSHHPT